jgi:3-isopropylmalate dehydrogenase
VLARFRDEFDAVYLGALGDPRVPSNVHAKDILLGSRFKLDLYINFRPIRLLDARYCPLNDKRPEDVDFVVFRENTEGLYTGVGGQFKRGTPDEIAIQEDVNTRKGVQRVIRYAFELAAQRREAGRPGRVTMVDKSNALYHGHDLWQRVFALERERTPAIEAEHLYVDVAAMQLVKNPARFDVIVTSNMFGDILSDLASQLVGGLGIAPSGNVNPETRRALFEPVHGSAPRHAGKGTANPLGAILSGALLLRHLGAEAAARDVEQAVAAAVRAGCTTGDLGGKLSTSATGEAVLQRLGEKIEAWPRS